MIVHASGLTRDYPGVRALDGLSLDIAPGDYVAVQGPSGSGKTTLLNLLAGLDRPTGGTLQVCGEDLPAMDPTRLNVFRRENVGLIFQQFHLVPYLTALENVMLAQYYHSMVDEGEASRALDQVGLGPRAGHLPAQLSGGEQQRVCLARALINQPRLVLADEPTGSLDRENRDRILEIFRDLNRRGQTLVVVTHDPRVAEEAGRRVYLEHGRLATPAAAVVHGDPDHVADDLLRELWILAEEAQPTVQSLLARVTEARPDDLDRLVRARQVLLDEERLALGEAAVDRAKFLVRRHRLAEVMLVADLGLSPDAVDPYAHALEHTLDPAGADRLCGRLDHPKLCPHGNPIPRGACCPG